MIDLHLLRENPEIYKAACEKKRIRFDIDAFLALDKEVRALRLAFESTRSEQNAFNKELPKLQGEEKQQKLAAMKQLSVSVKEKELELKEKEAEWLRQQYLIPSPPLPQVPLGKDDTENVEIRKVGTPKEFDFPIKDHATLGKELDIIDVERGVKIAGSRSYFLKGDGARLHHAVLQCALELIHQRGFTIMEPPHMVNQEAMLGTGYLPGGEESAYKLDDRDAGTYLIGTAEVPVASYYSGEIVDADKLPIRLAGYSPCYRREAGTYGKDTAGIYRIHQFFKVEQVVICKNDMQESERMHAEILGNAEALLQLLDIPYRVVDVCTGDMGQGQVYKNDIESWMPSRKSYGETHSCSTLLDFQSRRLNLRYRDEQGKTVYCHTLNNTLIATPRVLIPIIENNQRKDGSIAIPKALQKFMGGQEVIEARK